MTGTIQEYLLRKGTDGQYQAPGAWIRPNSRKKIYKRDHYTCFYCGKDLHGASPQEITLDHLLSREDGGTNDAENLVTACRHCNSGLERKLEEMKRKVLRQHFGKSLAKSRSRKRLEKDWVNQAAPMAGRALGHAAGAFFSPENAQSWGDIGEGAGQLVSEMRTKVANPTTEYKYNPSRDQFDTIHKPSQSVWGATKRAVNPVIQYGQAMVGGTRLGRGKIGAVTNAAFNAANFITNPDRPSLTVAPANLAIQTAGKLGLRMRGSPKPAIDLDGSNTARGKTGGEAGKVLGDMVGGVTGIDGLKEAGQALGQHIGANLNSIKNATGRVGGAVKNAVSGMTQGARRAISAPSTLAPVSRSLPVNRALWKSARIEARQRLGKSASSGIANVWARKWYEGRGGTWMRKAVLKNGSSSASVATRPVVQPSSQPSLQPSSTQPAEQKTGRRGFLGKLATGSIGGALAARYGQEAVNAGIDAAAPAIQNKTGVDIRSLDSIRNTVPQAIHDFSTPGYPSDKQGPVNTPLRRSLSSTRKRKRPW